MFISNTAIKHWKLKHPGMLLFSKAATSILHNLCKLFICLDFLATNFSSAGRRDSKHQQPYIIKSQSTERHFSY